jgi:hypothetical protein
MMIVDPRRLEIVALALINKNRAYYDMPAIDWDLPNLKEDEKTFWKEHALAAIEAWEAVRE